MIALAVTALTTPETWFYALLLVADGALLGAVITRWDQRRT